MSGEQRIPAPRAVVWDCLNDAEILKAAIPGCEQVTKLSDTNIEATVVAKVGPVKATFKGAVSLSDLDPPNGYTITGEGKGGVAGFGKGSAKVKLADDGPGTLMTYAVTASVGGKLAQLGSRLIDSTAKKLADDFFVKFSELAAARAAAASTGASTAAEAPAMTPPPASATVPPAQEEPGVSGKWVIAGLAAAVLGIIVVLKLMGSF